MSTDASDAKNNTVHEALDPRGVDAKNQNIATCARLAVCHPLKFIN